jgi:hypothetical protein
MTADVLSIDPFRVRLAGIVHQAVPVSAEAVVRYRRAIAAAATDADRERALHRFWSLAFPLSWAILWTGNPVRKILALPPAERNRLLSDFLLSLVAARRRGTTTAPTTAPNIPTRLAPKSPG